MQRTLFLSAVMLLVTVNGWAAPAYGTKLLQKGGVFTGGQTHFVGERELESPNGTMRSLQHLLLLSYGVTNGLSLDFKGGAGNAFDKRPGNSGLVYPSFVSGVRFSCQIA